MIKKNNIKFSYKNWDILNAFAEEKGFKWSDIRKGKSRAEFEKLQKIILEYVIDKEDKGEKEEDFAEKKYPDAGYLKHEEYEKLREETKKYYKSKSEIEKSVGKLFEKSGF